MTSNPPLLIDQAKVLKYLVLNETNIKTDNTTHYVDGKVVQEVYALAIYNYPNESGFYLFYCNRDWNTIADAFHETIEEAKEQAEFEYTNTMSAWI